MRNQPIPLINGFYADRARPFSMQDCCNWLPSVAEVTGTRTEVMLKTPPGLVPFAQLTGDPIRLVYEAEGRFFAVSGDSLYQIAPDSLPTLLGTIPGVTPVRAAHNQIENGNQIVFVNGSAGFVWNTVDSTFTTITDAGFPGAVDVVFCDGYFVFIEPSRRFAFNSDLADALAYNTLDRFTSEVSPDMLQGLAVNNNELVLFSETTTEFFENVGAAQQPFRSKRISFQKGAAARYGIAQIDNTVKWLANDGMFYKLDGYAPRRISNRPIEQAIRGKNWAQAFAFIWESEGHSVCYWTFPDGLTWGNDASQPPGLDWHRRESYGLTRWRINSTAFWQNAWYAGDFQTGRVWRLDWEYPMEGDTEMVGQITGPVMHDNQNLVQMPKLEIVMDTGMPAADTIEEAMFSLTGHLDCGYVGDSNAYTYGQTGGVLPVTWAVIDGALPPDRVLNPTTGEVTGENILLGDYSWTIGATDAIGRTAELFDECTVSGYEVFTWNAWSGLAAQNMNASFISGDIVAIVGQNGSFNYSLSRGDSGTWVTTTNHPGGTMFGQGVVKYAGDWYCFGAAGGVNMASKSPGDTMVFAALAAPGFVVSASGNAAFVIDDFMYVADQTPGVAPYRLMKTVDGTAFTALSTFVNATASGQSICSHTKTVDGWHIFGTTDGKVLRSSDLSVFTTVADYGAGQVSVAALGEVVLIASHSTTLIRRSTDSGATFDAGYFQGSRVLANGSHFIAAHAFKVWTSPTGESGTWTERLDADPLGSGVRGQGAASPTLAVFGTFGSYAYVGDLVP